MKYPLSWRPRPDLGAPSQKTPEPDAGLGPRGQRRELIAAAGGIAGLFLLGLAGRQASSSPTLIRPPGGADEARFTALCLRCDRCRSVCPQSVVSVGTLADGPLNLRTPVMDFRHGYCDFCMKCVDVCPTGALDRANAEEKALGVAKLTKTCIALRTGACRKCYDECPEEAINLSVVNVPIIENYLCTGCGLCVKVCPDNVLQSYSGSKERGIVVRPLPPKKGDKGAE